MSDRRPAVTFDLISPLVMGAVVLSLLTFGAARAEGSSARNETLYVVPAPGDVEIDGSLDDWDFSGHIPFYVVPETRQTRSAEIAMMYDDEALYVGGTVRDSSPMMNRHDPLTNPARAWDADVCQIFFGLNPDDELPLEYSVYNEEHVGTSPLATMMLWYFTDRREPSLAMFRGMGFDDALRPDLHENGHVPADYFEGAFQKDEDGEGYTFEYRIPWDTLNLERTPRADDTLAAAIAVFWGRPDGLKTAGGSAWAWNVMSRGGFPYQNTNCWGALEFLPEGDVPREWVEGDLPPERPLPLTFRYELPREGETTIQLFNQDNESVRILVPQQRRPEGINTESWDGLDDDGEPLPAGEYTWRGLVHDPLEMKHRFSVHNSGNPPYPTDDNTGGWGGDHGTPQAALALDDGMILSWSSTEYGWGIIRVDLDGQKQWGSKRTGEYLATDGERLFVAGGHGWSGRGGVKVLELADSRPLHFQPGMEQLPPPDGEGEPEVTGLACDGERIYVSYGQRDVIGVYDLDGELTAQWDVPAPGRLAMRPDGSVAAFSGRRVVAVNDGEISELVSEPLTEPRGLAVSDDDQIHVAEAGERQQVRVFDIEGNELRTIGKAGGRPAKGTYDASGMYEPGGIDLDARGRLWVAETTDGPKRISVWDSETGENVDEFFGSSAYFAYGHIDPARPNEILAHHVLWEIDWDTYETRPLTTIWRKTEPNMIPPTYPHGRSDGVPRMITADNGRQYLYGRRRLIGILMRRDGDLFKPFLATFRVAHGSRSTPDLPIINDNPDRFPDGNYLWQDRNDDQQVQADELIRLPGGRRFNNTHFSLDKDLSLYLNKGYRLRPVEVTEEGRPIYDFDQAEEVPVRSAPQSDGYVYPRFGDSTIARLDPQTGEALWRYTDITPWKRALDKPVVGPGRLWGTTGRMGVAGDYLAYMTYFGVNHLFHTNGTYVAALLEDKRTITEAGAHLSQPEGQGGSFVQLNIDGEDRYFIIHGGQDTRVWEVLGLDTMELLSGGTYQHTEDHVAAAREALAEWEAATADEAKLVIKHGKDALAEAEPVVGEVDDDLRFEARLARDDENLYVRYDVNTPHPLTNATSEQRIIFRGGNCLDIQLATDPDADPQREEPAPGDVRLLVTRQNGQPFAMLYRPRVEGFDGERIVFDSPTGEEPFDVIEPMHVGLDYERTDTGFTATVTIPLERIGLELASGETVRMDLGYIFGNSEGTRTAARAYVHNDSFTANVVDDIPHESRIEPAEWGEAEVE